MRLSLCLAVLAFSTPALANDGFGGLAATGLTFGQTDAVAMEEEDLTIGIDRITVDYVFRNLTAADVTGEVIFPLPPIHVGYLMESSWNLPEDTGRENLVGFRAVVDGKEVAVSVDRIAVLEPQWEEGRQLSFQYDTPGTDVTADLERLGIPLSLDLAEVMDALAALTPKQQAEATKLGIATFDGGYIYAGWSVILRYHWTQTFPANAVVKVSHDYENRSGGGILSWSHPPEDYMQAVADQYCIDDGTSRALTKALARPPEADGQVYSVGMSWNIAYVLRTANSWAGPIKRFKLTLDKGAPENIISLCAEGIKKTGPTTFVMEKTDFVPDRDLEILIAVPMED
jgi:Domain of unknown function (DUF4424)